MNCLSISCIVSPQIIVKDDVVLVTSTDELHVKN